MKHLVPYLLIGSLPLVAAPAAQAQLSGIKTINPAGAGANNYPTFGSAVAALNASGVAAGGVTFNVQAGAIFDEALPSLTASGTAAGPIIFQKTAGAVNPKIQGTGTGAADAALTLDGADYVQFTGIDVEDKLANATAAQQLEYGVLLQNGATYNTFSNATVALNRANTNRTNGVALLGGGNNQNQFISLTVQNCSYGYDLEGTTTLYDEGTVIRGLAVGQAGLPSRVLSIGVPPPGAAGGIAFATYGIYLKSQTNARVINTEISGVTGTSSVYGIYSTGTTNSVEVADCLVHGMSGSGSTGIVMGMYVASGTTHTFRRNRTYDIEALGTSGFAAGFDITGGTTNYLSNNMVYDVRAAASGAGTSVRAFSFRGGNNYAYHNTVVLSYAATNPANKSGALFMSGGPTVDLRNNIFVNLVSGLASGGGGIAAAFFKNNTITTSLSAGSNNNIYYAGPPSTERLIFYGALVGTTPAALDQTLTQYKTRFATVEQASLTELPPFVNTTDPHLLTGQPTRAENGGTSVVATPFPVPSDIDGNLRNTATPDIGADEGVFTALAARNRALSTVTAAVAPNPTSRGVAPALHLSGPAQLLTLTITDALGRAVGPARTVRHAAGTEALPLPASLAPGLYVLHLCEPTTGAALSRKLVVQ